MVARTARLSRDNRQQGGHNSKASKENAFEMLLGKTIRETAEPNDVYTVTYDAHSILQTYSYHRPTEYTF